MSRSTSSKVEQLLHPPQQTVSSQNICNEVWRCCYRPSVCPGNEEAATPFGRRQSKTNQGGRGGAVRARVRVFIYLISSPYFSIENKHTFSKVACTCAQQEQEKEGGQEGRLSTFLSKSAEHIRAAEKERRKKREKRSSVVGKRQILFYINLGPRSWFCSSSCSCTRSVLGAVFNIFSTNVSRLLYVHCEEVVLGVTSLFKG